MSDVFKVPYCCTACANAGYENELRTAAEIFEHECREHRARYWLSEAFRPRFHLVRAVDMVGHVVDGQIELVVTRDDTYLPPSSPRADSDER